MKVQFLARVLGPGSKWMDSQRPIPNTGVVYGKPMRKFRPTLLQEPEADESVSKQKLESLAELSPTKQATKTLLEESSDLKRSDTVKEESIGVDKRLLLSALSLAKDSAPVQSTWRPYSYVKTFPQPDMSLLRQNLKIIVEGSDIPPLALDFKDIRMPQAITDYLIRVKHIKKPSLIQMQAICTALAGRDFIGVASTGSGKTLAFCIPMILSAMEAEMKLELLPGEGPIGIILAPSRELARQTFQQCCEIADHLASTGFPSLKIVNLIGGLPIGDQISLVKKGVHLIVGTPGRTLDFLEKGHIALHSCRQMCLDEADRMIDLGFEEDLRGILSHSKHKIQMLLFSATMPNSIKEFAMKALDTPILINVGRAGAANLNIVQEVELVDKNKRLGAILDALQKTAPPVIVFASSKGEVDDVLEFLLLKGVEAVAIHGGKTQEERIYAIDSFKSGKKDVLVANDIASKGLDLQCIQHVINYDMPCEIEDYVHRIGRTGRGGRTGIATTFIDTSLCTDAVMLDLAHLLNEAQQYIPPFLQKLLETAPKTHPCSICGGLGHGIDKCPKIGAMASKQYSNIRNADYSAEY